MTPEYESKIIETFFRFLENGLCLQGAEAGLWCMHDRTALAEAEVEYEMHTSPSVYVRYRLTSPPEAIDPRLAGKRVSTIIWTTTPWTLPASLAVAFHPGFRVCGPRTGWGGLHRRRGAGRRHPRRLPLESAQEIARFPGSRMERVTFAHPFPGSHDPGRFGHLCHHRPGDRRRAYRAGAWRRRLRHRRALRLEPDMRRGRWRPDAHGLPEYDGLYVFKANEPIIDLLAHGTP